MKPKLNKLIQRAALLLFAFVAVVAQAADKKPEMAKPVAKAEAASKDQSSTRL